MYDEYLLYSWIPLSLISDIKMNAEIKTQDPYYKYIHAVKDKMIKYKLAEFGADVFREKLWRDAYHKKSSWLNYKELCMKLGPRNYELSRVKNLNELLEETRSEYQRRFHEIIADREDRKDCEISENRKDRKDREDCEDCEDSKDYADMLIDDSRQILKANNSRIECVNSKTDLGHYIVLPTISAEDFYSLAIKCRN